LRTEGKHQAPVVTGIWPDPGEGDNVADLELIQTGLAELSVDHRQVIELTYFCGFSYQEIADIAGCPVNTVKTRMFHARRRLKVLLPRLAGNKSETQRDQA
jgi:RNA polymerase sigma-70 factor (ECF subfamily)